MSVARAVLLPLLVLSAAAPAQAQTPPPAVPAPPDERAAAREFSFAAYRARLAVKAQKPAIEAALNARLEALDDPRCERAVNAAPRAAEDAVLAMTIVLIALPLIDGIRGPAQQLVVELERVPTADQALRSGRAAWRAQAQFFARLPTVPDMCAALDAWRQAGYGPGGAPIPLEAFQGGGLETVERKLAAAAARMRELGVSAGAARRFTGDTLLQGIGDDVKVGPSSAGGRPARSSRRLPDTTRFAGVADADDLFYTHRSRAYRASAPYSVASRSRPRSSVSARSSARRSGSTARTASGAAGAP
jgi:hypothetical protein